MVTDLHDVEREKRKNVRKEFHLLFDFPDFSSKNISWKLQKTSLNTNSEFMPQFSEINELSGRLLIDKSQYKN